MPGTETDADSTADAIRPLEGQGGVAGVENANPSQLCEKYEVPSLIWALIFFPLAKWDQVRQPGSLGGLRNVKPFLFLSNCIEWHDSTLVTHGLVRM